MKTGAEKTKNSIKADSEYAQTILNSLTAHVAVIDKNGIIIETNRAWKRFGVSNQIQMRPDTLGINYLDVCEKAMGDDKSRSKEVAKGIRNIINGNLDEFVIDYPCNGPDREYWFYMRATRATGYNPVRVVISHEDITALKTAESMLRRREKDLEIKSRSLEDVNAALRVLLRQREEDKKELEEAISLNIREDVLPRLERLRQLPQTKEGDQLLDLAMASLKDISSPFLQQLNAVERILSPREIEIARLIKSGKTTKDIAELLHLSHTTVSFHRRNLRDKMGLKNTAGNLRTYLLSLDIRT